MQGSVLRGASAIYYLHKGNGILLDCAEGSYGQLMDYFGDEKLVNDCLRTTRAIVITHIHGDH
jgi:ribonuclease BN (tRNA processing enzyme)